MLPDEPHGLRPGEQTAGRSIGHSNAAARVCDPQAPRIERALLVEDNNLNQQVPSELHMNAGLAVEVAHNGKVAVRIARQIAKQVNSFEFHQVLALRNNALPSKGVR